MKLKGSILWFACLVSLLCACSKMDSDEEWPDPSTDLGLQTLKEERTLIGTLELLPSGRVHLRVGGEPGLYLYRFRDVPPSTPRRVMGRFIVYPKYKRDLEAGYYADVDWMEYIDLGNSKKGGTYPGSGEETANPGGVGDSEPPETPPSWEELHLTGDGMDVLDDWMTTVEDGYFTVHYKAWWGDSGIQHDVKMNVYEDAYKGDGSYVLCLIHDAHGDSRDIMADAMICFDINYLYPATEKDKTLTVKWKTSAGDYAERQFLFKPR